MRGRVTTGVVTVLCAVLVVWHAAGLASSWDYGYWAHRVSLGRESSDVYRLIADDGTLREKHLAFYVLGGELAGSELVLSDRFVITNVELETAVFAWGDFSGVRRCVYDPFVLDAAAVLRLAGSERVVLRSGDLRRRGFDGAFEALREGRLSIFDGASGPYLMFGLDGHPRGDGPMAFIQADLLVEVGVGVPETCWDLS